MVRWVDGELDNYPTGPNGLGTEHRVLDPNPPWRGASAITTGRYTANAHIDDVLVRWADGHTTMFTDTTLNVLGAEQTLVSTPGP
jgi:hypothetical protein